MLTQNDVELKVFERCKMLKYKSGAFTYIGSINTKLDLTCECGYNWNPTYTDFINSKTGCPKCSGRLKTTQIEAEQKVSEKCIEKNISCEPFIFINNKMKLNLTCNTCGQNWNTTTYKKFIYNSSCPKCAGVMKLTQKEAEEKVNLKCLEHNLQIQNFKYKNIRTKLELTCNVCNYNWDTTNFSDFIYRNVSCPCCNHTMVITQYISEERVKQKCEEKQYSYKPFKYIGVDNTYLELTCNNGHTWKTTKYTEFVSNNTGCPICKISKLEIKIKNLLDNNKINYEPQYKPKCLKTKFQQSLDFYLYDYNIAIECQGDQHFTPVDFGGLGEKWATDLHLVILERDKRKYNLCKKEGIRILYFTNYKNIPDNYLDTIYTIESDLLLQIKNPS